MRKSLRVALTAVFAALHVVLYTLSFGLWRSWAIYLEPLEGIVLGPWAGSFAALLGSGIGRMIRPISDWMFGVIAEPMGVLAVGFLAKGRWKPVIGLYVVMLTAYFAHPFGRWFPLWTILDVLLALVLIYPTARLSRNILGNNLKHLCASLALVSFIGTVTDSLTRIFLLVPGGFYLLLGWPPEAVFDAFFFGAGWSYVEDVLVVLTSFLVGVPTLLALRKFLASESSST
jgi:predicted membrane protein